VSSVSALVCVLHALEIWFIRDRPIAPPGTLVVDHISQRYYINVFA
jgi:hypothetical protein